MKHSTDRILTTHAGSLPRPPDLLDLIQGGGAKALDQASNAVRLRQAVGEVVRKQVELGIDVVDDGEYGKPNPPFDRLGKTQSAARRRPHRVEEVAWLAS